MIHGSACLFVYGDKGVWKKTVRWKFEQDRVHLRKEVTTLNSMFESVVRATKVGRLEVLHSASTGFQVIAPSLPRSKASNLAISSSSNSKSKSCALELILATVALLGRGTQLEKSQQHCYSVDVSHAKQQKSEFGTVTNWSNVDPTLFEVTIVKESAQRPVCAER
jgi:hypothetical protein